MKIYHHSCITETENLHSNVNSVERTDMHSGSVNIGYFIKVLTGWKHSQLPPPPTTTACGRESGRQVPGVFSEGERSLSRDTVCWMFLGLKHFSK